MRKPLRAKSAVISFMLLVLLLVAGFVDRSHKSGPGQPPTPTPTPTQQPSNGHNTPLQVWAWNGEHDPAIIRKQLGNLRGIGMLMPGWFELIAEDGELYDLSDDAVVRDIHKRGMKVAPLVSNRHRADMTAKFLDDPSAIETFIRTLANRMTDVGMAGVNLDFEGLKKQSRESYSVFIEKLAEAFRNRGLSLSVDVPVTASGGLPDWFDAERIGAAADQIIIMAYDQYYEGSPEPGPVSGMAWSERGIKSALDGGVPANKLVLGIPLYSREWRINNSGKPISSRPVSMKALPGTYIGYDNVTRKWDEKNQLYRVRYGNEDEHYIVWEENAATVKARYALAREYGLCGVAVWRLGYENADFWKAAEAWKTQDSDKQP